MIEQLKGYEAKKKRRIFLSILTTIFVGVVLTATTYAWFTSNQNVNVEKINLSVAAQNGLQISTDAENWKTVIDADDILAATSGSSYKNNDNMVPFKSKGQIVPVSTVGDIGSAGKLAFFKGNLGKNGLTATAITEKNGTSGELIAFDLFFRVTEDSQVYLTHSSNVTSEDTTDKGLKNAARVAWLYEGAGPLDEKVSTLQGYKATSTDANNILVWEPNSDLHTSAGSINARNYGFDNTTVNKLDYVGIKSAISTPVDVNSKDTNYFGKVKGLFSTTSNVGVPAGTKWFPLRKGIAKVRFYLWVEGQDVDCENTASGSSISYNMQFSLLTT